jgi:hypothetical protein
MKILAYLTLGLAWLVWICARPDPEEDTTHPDNPHAS